VEGRPGMAATASISTTRAYARPDLPPLRRTDRSSQKKNLMAIRTNTRNLLDNPPIPVQAKLAAAWTSFMFLYIYVDYFHLYQPGAIDEIRGGVIFEFDISGTLLTIFLALTGIPALLVMLSMTLPARVNRATAPVSARRCRIPAPFMSRRACG